MPTVSDYWVLHDGFFTLELAGQNPDILRSFSFGGVSNIFVQGTNRAKPMLQFKLRAFADNSRLLIAYASQELDQSRRIVTNELAFFDREFDRSSIRTHYTFLNGATLADHQNIVFQINGAEVTGSKSRTRCCSTRSLSSRAAWRRPLAS